MDKGSAPTFVARLPFERPAGRCVCSLEHPGLGSGGRTQVYVGPSSVHLNCLVSGGEQGTYLPSGGSKHFVSHIQNINYKEAWRCGSWNSLGGHIESYVAGTREDGLLNVCQP